MTFWRSACCTSVIYGNPAHGPRLDDEPFPGCRHSFDPGVQWLQGQRMPQTAVIAMRSKHPGKVAGALLLVAGLLLLVGCQGVSAAGSSGQQQSGTLSLLTSTLVFGSVAVGSSKTLTVTATNSGPASLTISSVAISTKYYSLVAPSLPLAIAAGQSATISIKFAPSAAGIFNTCLLYTSPSPRDMRRSRMPSSA